MAPEQSSAVPSASNDQPKPMASARISSSGAFWGAMLGVNGWVVGLLCYAIAVGEFRSVLYVVVGGFILSTGVGLLLLLPSARPGSADWFGRLLIAMALLSTLYMHWASRQLEQVASLSWTNRWYAAPDLLILAIGLAGIIVVTIARCPHKSVAALRERLGWIGDVV